VAASHLLNFNPYASVANLKLLPSLHTWHTSQ
jgi:hypothetical protein